MQHVEGNPEMCINGSPFPKGEEEGPRAFRFRFRFSNVGLFVVAAALQNGFSPIELLHQEESGHFVGKGHGG